MDDAIKYLHNNNTWNLIKGSAGSKLVNCRWIYKVKDGIKGVEARRFKVILVARDFTQKEMIDLNDVLSPVVKHKSIRILLAMVENFYIELEHMDVKLLFYMVI